jgi:hypothetical protein
MTTIAADFDRYWAKKIAFVLKMNSSSKVRFTQLY